MLNTLIHYFRKTKQAISRRTYPIFCTWIAKIKLRSINARFGSGFWVDGKIVIPIRKSRITFGNNVRLRSRYKSNLVGMSFPITLQTIRNGQIDIGDNCGISSVIISSRKKIKIGNNVLIGGDVRIYDHDFHSLNFIDRRTSQKDRENAKSSEVIIEDDVFIGTSSIILKGVTIGARSIIGAGSIVSLKRIPADSIVAGNPAKVIKINSK